MILMGQMASCRELGALGCLVLLGGCADHGAGLAQPRTRLGFSNRGAARPDRRERLGLPRDKLRFDL